MYLAKMDSTWTWKGTEQTRFEKHETSKAMLVHRWPCVDLSRKDSHQSAELRAHFLASAEGQSSGSIDIQDKLSAPTLKNRDHAPLGRYVKLFD